MSLNSRLSISGSLFGSITVHIAILIGFLWWNTPIQVVSQASKTLSAKLVKLPIKSENIELPRSQSLAANPNTKPAPTTVSSDTPIKVIAAVSRSQTANKVLVKRNEPASKTAKAKPSKIIKPAQPKTKETISPTSVIAKTIEKPVLKQEAVKAAKPVVSKKKVETSVVVKNPDLPKKAVAKLAKPKPTIEPKPTEQLTQPAPEHVAALNDVDHVKRVDRDSLVDAALASSAAQATKPDKPIDFANANLRVKKMTRPKYPHYAILQRQSGTAIVAIELDVKGAVKASKLHVSSAHRVLDKAALHVSKKWRFFPPVPIGEIIVPVRFELECSGNACRAKQVQQG